MNRCIGLLGFLVMAAPSVVLAAEPAWWTQQKRTCGLSSGLAYNTWMAQGSPCNNRKSSSSSSAASIGGAIGTELGTMIGDELNKAFWGDPAEDARRKAQEAQRLEQQQAEEAQRAEQQRRAHEEALRKAEETKNRLLAGMMGVDGLQPLGLMGVEPRSELSLMMESAPAPVPPAAKKSMSFTKGFEHASQCISQNSGSACAGVAANLQQTCVADYRGGYESGSIQQKLVLQEAHQAGKDAAARGELANAASDSRALGPCRNDWIMAYNNGYGVKAPLPVGGKTEVAVVAKVEPGLAKPAQAVRPATNNATGSEPPAIKKTLGALDCAVNSALGDYKAAQGGGAVDAASLQADLATIKNILRIPPSGKKNTYQTQSITLSQLQAEKTGESQKVGAILVSRNEETGEVYIDVSQSSSHDAGASPRKTGRAASAKESQNIIVLDRSGKILNRQVTGSVGKCLDAK